MIEIKDLTFRYACNEERTVMNASCRCPAEGVTALVGGSGVGKSTIMALLAGLYLAADPAVGELRGEMSINGLVPTAFRGAALASWVPQTATLLDHLLIRENILLPTELFQEGEQPVERYDSLLRALGIHDKSAKRPKQLSGGERTRTCLARALITSPRYLFLDEPFSSLDLGTRWRLYRLIREERARPDATTIITTHNIPEAMLLADRVVIVRRNEFGTELEVVESEPLEMLGEAFGAQLSFARERAVGVEARAYGSAESRRL